MTEDMLVVLIVLIVMGLFDALLLSSLNENRRSEFELGAQNARRAQRYVTSRSLECGESDTVRVDWTSSPRAVTETEQCLAKVSQHY